MKELPQIGAAIYAPNESPGSSTGAFHLQSHSEQREEAAVCAILTRSVRINLQLRTRAPLGHRLHRTHFLVAALPASADKVAVHGRDHLQLNFLRTRTCALADIGAPAKALRVHLRHHVQRATVPFR